MCLLRVPGNAAAVQLLQDELDNKEPEAINFEEEVRKIDLCPFLYHQTLETFFLIIYSFSKKWACFLGRNPIFNSILVFMTSTKEADPWNEENSTSSLIYSLI